MIRVNHSNSNEHYTGARRQLVKFGGVECLFGGAEFLFEVGICKDPNYYCIYASCLFVFLWGVFFIYYFLKRV